MLEQLLRKIVPRRLAPYTWRLAGIVPGFPSTGFSHMARQRNLFYFAWLLAAILAIPAGAEEGAALAESTPSAKAAAADAFVRVRRDERGVAQALEIAVVRLPPLHGALDRLVDGVERDLGGRLAELSREDKQRAVRMLDERGAFVLRRAVEDIADAMGVSRITVYRRFANKTALVDHVVRREIRRYFDQFLVDIEQAETVADRVVVGFVSSLRAIRHNPLIRGLMAADPNIAVDVLMGVGGSPEGVISAAALKCLRGAMQCKLWPRNEQEARKGVEAGLDLDRVLTIDDLVASDNVFFAVTGIFFFAGSSRSCFTALRQIFAVSRSRLRTPDSRV